MTQARGALVFLACIAAAAACGGKSDDTCQQLVDKMTAVMEEEHVTKADERKEQALGVEECRKHLDEMKTHPQTRCILAAKSTDEVRTCMADYLKHLEGEAQFELKRIERAAMRVALEHGSFPKGTARVLPSAPVDNFTNVGPCCNSPGFKCAVTKDWASDPIWKALGFAIDETSYFQYSYESSDGVSFKATAVGDMDCDTVRATYALSGKIGGNKVTTDLVESSFGIE